MTNYHTHTRLCKHADGVVADYLAAATAAGCEALGFSDHCPYPDDGIDTWPRIRMTPAEAPSYVRDIREAAAPFPLYCGFECEWAPRYEGWYRDTLLGEYGADYLVLGSHWVEKGDTYVYITDVTDEADVRAYFAQTIRGMSTGLYRFLAHPDLIMANGRDWSAELAALFSALIDAAIDCDMPLEINGCGLIRSTVTPGGERRYPYPVRPFWELAAKKGAAIICNSDAHRPADTIDGAKKGRDFAAELRLRVLDRIDIL